MMNKFVKNIVRKWQLVLYISLMLGAVTFFVSTAVTPKYRSDITVLIVQKNADVLTASQNAEYLSEIFQKVLYTESFMRGVLKSDGEIQREFSADAGKRVQEWEDEIQSYKVGSAGILKISVFDPTRQDAYKIAVGVLRNFKENSAEYFGEKGEVEIKVLDGPITSSGIAYPNIKQNTLFGLVVGFIGSLFVIYFFKDFDLRLVKRDKRGLAFSLKSSEKAIEQKIGDQLARQLEKRKDNIALEYLEKQVKQQDAQGTALGAGIAKIFSKESLREDEEAKAEKAEKERKRQLEDQQAFANSELEYIEIPKEEDFVIEEEVDEFIGFNKKQAKDVAANMSKKEEIQTVVAPDEIVASEEPRDNFWENMRAIDEQVMDLDEENDNPLLADSMIDIDKYHEIIRAGETFKGFKKNRREEIAKGVDEIANMSNAELKDLLLEDELGSEASVPVISHKEEALPTKVPQKSLQKATEPVVSKDANKKKAEERKEGEVRVMEAVNKASEEIGAVKEVKEIKEVKEVEEAEELELTAVGLRKILETQSTEQWVEIKKNEALETPEVAMKKEVATEKRQAGLEDETDEDFEEIVQEKKEKEKNEIKRLLEEELDKKAKDAQKEADLIAEKEEDSSKVVEEAQIAKPKKSESIESVESINFIGSGDEEELEERVKEMSHHIEMDPEELEMMRKMLKAEGKTEEEFVVEHGLVEQKKAEKLAEKKKEEKPAPAPKEAIFEEIEESVRKVQVGEDNSQDISRGKKGAAPSGLPVFMEEESEQDAFARKLREEKTPQKASVDPEREVSEKEIKEKLNRLLQGEL